MQFDPSSFTDNYGLYVIIETVPGVAFHENNFRVVGITKSKKTAEKYSGPNRIIRGPVTMLDGDILPVKTQNPEPKFPFDVYYHTPEVPGFHKTIDPAKVNFHQFTPGFNFPNQNQLYNPNPLNKSTFFTQGYPFNSNKDSNKMDID